MGFFLPVTLQTNENFVREDVTNVLTIKHERKSEMQGFEVRLILMILFWIMI